MGLEQKHKYLYSSSPKNNRHVYIMANFEQDTLEQVTLCSDNYWDYLGIFPKIIIFTSYDKRIPRTEEDQE